MKVLVWPGTPLDEDGFCNDGVAMYRLVFPAQALMRQGADVEFTFGGPKIVWDVDWRGKPCPPSHANVVEVRPMDADVLVTQRPARRWMVDIIERLQAYGTKVVIDMDDRLDQIPDGNVAKGHLDPKERDWANHQWVSKACRAADLVTCTTQGLADRFGYGHSAVLPNLVPKHYLRIEAERRPLTLGWSGSIGTHPGDLEVTKGGVQLALSKNPAWSFHVVGTGKGVAKGLGLRDEPSNTKEWVDFKDYPKVLAELELGIVPLADNTFNRTGKSRLKASEMAALGIPVVMSPTPDNEHLHRLGVGLLASSPGRWAKHLAILMKSEQYRAELAGKGKSAMRSQTYDRHAERWWDAWVGTTQRAKRSA